MSHHGKHTITDWQHKHLQIFLTAYAEGQGVTFAEMSRQANMGDGSIAAVVRNRKPSRLFVRRLMHALDVTEEQLVGPPAPACVDIPGEPPMASVTPGEVPRETDDVWCAMWSTLQQSLGVLKDMRAVLLAMHDTTSQGSKEEHPHARIF